MVSSDNRMLLNELLAHTDIQKDCSMQVNEGTTHITTMAAGNGSYPRLHLT